MRTQIAWIKTRKIGLFMAIVYIWLSAVVELTHTDDLRAFATVYSTSQVPAQLQSCLPPVPDQPCLAHEWSGAVHSATAATTTVALESQGVATCTDPIPAALHLRCFDHNYLRGPPSASA
jgi:hypothetical protein